MEIGNKPCIKLSEEFQKTTFPGKKNLYRIYDKKSTPIVDLLTKADEPAPKVGEEFLCRHPFMVQNRQNASWQNAQDRDFQFSHL